MTIKLYNTMTRQKENFVPREPDKVKMYVCGPTTYNFIHLGNARPLIVFDTIRRYFLYKGYQVTYVQNFTDIDDKIINRAQEEKMDPLDLAQKYIGEYHKDAKALGVLEADLHPKVSEHIPDVVEMIQTLIDKEFAYEIDGDVYFAVDKFDAYGKLSGRELEDMQAGARVGVDERKRNPMDFALWKSAKPGEPSWESPWGPGRPGWHIECSAMSIKYLGAEFDIHGGGFDLIFPHHENEIAQSEAYCGKPFAKYWMHNGFITVNEEKMSKSLGNFFTVREILGKYDPEVVRFYMLSTHYRSPLDFDDSKLEMNKRSLERLKNTIDNLAALLKNKPIDQGFEAGVAEFNEIIAGVRAKFEEAMDDDFNTALAIATFFDLARDINSFIAKQDQLGQASFAALASAKETMEALGAVLGLFHEQAVQQVDDGLADGLMRLILEIRAESRAKKDWGTADKIRNTLTELGVVIEDTAQGPRWKRK